MASQQRYTPAILRGLQLNEEVFGRDQLIGIYYLAGYTVREIMGFLAIQHETVISERQIHRILRGMNLQRRENHANLEDVVTAIMEELGGTGQNIGYRSMYRRLLTDHNITTTMETVRLALHILDREGILMRRHHRIGRRTYSNSGPNFAIHIDGWDKLKPFGISVHACVDGFSRRVLWIQACDSNKNPQYIAKFYMDAIRDMNGIPVMIYADRGTENSIVRDIQCVMRWHHNDPFQGLSTFQYGSSTRNTRIERFWRNLRCMCGQTFMDLFKGMSDVATLIAGLSILFKHVKLSLTGPLYLGGCLFYSLKLPNIGYFVHETEINNEYSPKVFF